MWAFFLLLIISFVFLIVSLIFLVKFCFKVISKFIDNKKLSLLLSFIPLVILFILCCVDMVNTVVVYLHSFVIVLSCKFVFFIISKILKKSFNEYIPVILGILLTLGIMYYGYYNFNHVVETNYVLYSTKDLGVEKFRVVQISDSHLGYTMSSKRLSKYIDKINDLNPDIVVVTGDLIDDGTSKDEMIDGAKELGRLKTKYGVYFAYGNHDKGYSRREYSNDEFIEELNNNNVTILEDEGVYVTGNIALIGRNDASSKDRKSVSDLVSEYKDSYIIMLDHQPNDFENESNSSVDLVLSGHTHGGQLVPLGPLGVWLGANDAYRGLEVKENTKFIINSGISDWALKFKTGARSEYVVIDIKNIF